MDRARRPMPIGNKACHARFVKAQQERHKKKLREMKALRERVVEHIAVCKKYGYCGYAKEDPDPTPDAPQPPPPPQAPAPREPLPPSSRVGDEFQADIPDRADLPD